MLWWNWTVELISGGQTLAEVQIQTFIFQGNPISPLLFFRVMMPVNYKLRKCPGYNHHHHHHHVVPLTRISLTLSRHFSLSFIASGRSSRIHPVSSHSCCMYDLAGRPALARPYVGVHRSTSLMSSSLLLQQWPACLARLTWIVFVMGDRWPYSWCFVGCCHQNLLNIARKTEPLWNWLTNSPT